MDKVGFVYILKGKDRYKIGYSRNPQSRLAACKNMNEFPVEIVLTKEVDDWVYVERLIHEKYGEFRVNREWFDFGEIPISDVVDFITREFPSRRLMSDREKNLNSRLMDIITNIRPGPTSMMDLAIICGYGGRKTEDLVRILLERKIVEATYDDGVQMFSLSRNLPPAYEDRILLHKAIIGEIFDFPLEGDLKDTLDVEPVKMSGRTLNVIRVSDYPDNFEEE